IPPQRSGYLAFFVALGGTAYATKPLITGAGIQDGSLPDADIAAANNDETAGTPSLRTLGAGAQQAMPGNAKIGTSQFSRTIPAVRATGVRQTIPTGGVRTVPHFAFELYDTAALYNSTAHTSRLTAPVAGVYRMSANVRWPLRDHSTGYREV